MAPIPRVSPGALRLRPAAAARTAPLFRNNGVQRRAQTMGPDDLGGPGGSKPPPQRPGGPEAVKRNWPLIGGGALAVLALYAYSTGGGPKKGDMDKVAKKGEEGLRKAEGSARSAMGEMSGKKEGMGGFRSE